VKVIAPPAFQNRKGGFPVLWRATPTLSANISVMAGLVPAIHVLPGAGEEGVDARDVWREDALGAFAQA
jgi:hypothetical protein